MGQQCNEIFQKQKHHHKSDKHHHKRDYHKTKGNEVITEQEEIENKHNIKHNQSSQLMMSKFNLSNFTLTKRLPIFNDLNQNLTFPNQSDPILVR